MEQGGGDAPGLIGEPGVEGALVAVGVDGDGGQIELARGANDPHGDLAAISDEQLGDSPIEPTWRADRP